MLPVLSGLVAGFIHVLSGPDHLAAVAPLALDDRARGWVAGWSWGIGHATGVVCVATIAVMLRAWLPPLEVLSSWGERLVGVALVAVGVWALKRSTTIAAARHAHGSEPHEHLYLARGPVWLKRLGHSHSSFAMGVLHGVAGSSHFFGVLPALALPSTTASMIYIGAFGIGSVGAMAGFAAGVSQLGGHGSGPATLRGLMTTSGLVAVVIGTYWLL